MRFRSFPRMYIDCTSDKTICSIGQKVVFNEATAIAQYRNTGTVLAVGDEAAALENTGSSSIEVLRPIVCGKVADPTAMVTLLQLLLTRAEHSFSTINRLVGISGRVAHASKVSPAQLHTWNMVLKMAGMQGLVLTPRSQAILAKVREKTQDPQVFVCEIGSDSTELTSFIGSESTQVARIKWGTAVLHTYIQKVIADELGFAISRESARQILTRLINCLGFFESGERNKVHKISLKGKELSSTLSKSFVVSSSIFFESSANAFKPIVDGLLDFFEEGMKQRAEPSVAPPLFVLGTGENIAGFEAFLAHSLLTDVTWLPEPDLVVQQGLVLLDK